ncbi:hypothetical protein CAOG_00786 [Capsaspora owczarzaki ATCC 30864]|uniref:Uncharacterized protein n=1 Tax=Capsaspora owczarzaki (strain ATCC 30864) TaxID=595528 RepID=A0A0D2WHV7_CAPO3|nr:hypothetical protein CAOG_00786 [Capsaspora owczarzaki ATCC 30864]KJE89285.1 hypothetical protein CAOG_000786 [Capsaspora owczarzaki ATCC 30864]|eukprot:XP_004365657.1 hypothetical protein CAOG_00786 [Capsaspora owczarzaki ATCC 30864]
MSTSALDLLADTSIQRFRWDDEHQVPPESTHPFAKLTASTIATAPRGLNEAQRGSAGSEAAHATFNACARVFESPMPPVFSSFSFCWTLKDFRLFPQSSLVSSAAHKCASRVSWALLATPCGSYNYHDDLKYMWRNNFSVSLRTPTSEMVNCAVQYEWRMTLIDHHNEDMSLWRYGQSETRFVRSPAGGEITGVQVSPPELSLSLAELHAPFSNFLTRNCLRVRCRVTVKNIRPLTELERVISEEASSHVDAYYNAFVKAQQKPTPSAEAMPNPAANAPELPANNDTPSAMAPATAATVKEVAEFARPAAFVCETPPAGVPESRTADLSAPDAAALAAPAASTEQSEVPKASSDLALRPDGVRVQRQRSDEPASESNSPSEVAAAENENDGFTTVTHRKAKRSRVDHNFGGRQLLLGDVVAVAASSTRTRGKPAIRSSVRIGVIVALPEGKTCDPLVRWMTLKVPISDSLAIGEGYGVYVLTNSMSYPPISSLHTKPVRVRVVRQNQSDPASPLQFVLLENLSEMCGVHHHSSPKTRQSHK